MLRYHHRWKGLSKHGDVHTGCSVRSLTYKTLTLATRLYYFFAVLAGLLGLVLLRRFSLTRSPVAINLRSTSRAMATAVMSLPKTQAQWKNALDDLPANPEKVPAFFFGHGSPMLAFSESEADQSPILKHAGPTGPLATFLRDFGPAVLEKYRPRAIVVFSAHWDTLGERQGE